MHRAPVTKTGITFFEALVNLGHEAVAALPQGNEIEFKEAASDGPEGVHVDGGMGGACHLKSDSGQYVDQLGPTVKPPPTHWVKCP
ncbi:hypothetical protein O5699_25780 [Escherichia coli]|nr:hypothetical protein [Escherichia coli]